MARRPTISALPGDLKVGESLTDYEVRKAQESQRPKFIIDLYPNSIYGLAGRIRPYEHRRRFALPVVEISSHTEPVEITYKALGEKPLSIPGPEPTHINIRMPERCWFLDDHRHLPATRKKPIARVQAQRADTVVNGPFDYRVPSALIEVRKHKGEAP